MCSDMLYFPKKVVLLICICSHQHHNTHRIFSSLSPLDFYEFLANRHHTITSTVKVGVLLNITQDKEKTQLAPEEQSEQTTLFNSYQFSQRKPKQRETILVYSISNNVCTSATQDDMNVCSCSGQESLRAYVEYMGQGMVWIPYLDPYIGVLILTPRQCQPGCM